ncbi:MULTISPECIES: hypothetical protein [unclassified Breznakia]|uniref:hypothetical protein n=1 Tax=unclassified Breznakia TaxID=2623764 RepID=UPI0024757BF8|nr:MULTISPECIES: hypothetical protein [unclassified Breznakia]MDH6366081.1 uncharacterized protein HemY [Breznakia sp. PH1-1]MDH6402987.1 uncharacterized protein HemY [Breznakia sp. PF1-11]MDH6410696.1 uncharacterized protein HemY [Breznakia sp. PFB1-11]MDH6413247.1 uncharacterized protein HemY [Breznakia sp. PFB1-14]MDH6415615.1 uncharacterized protein HemY [Breznakia sp. PFB1-4]
MRAFNTYIQSIVNAWRQEDYGTAIIRFAIPFLVIMFILWVIKTILNIVNFFFSPVVILIALFILYIIIDE